MAVPVVGSPDSNGRLDVSRPNQVNDPQPQEENIPHCTFQTVASDTALPMQRKALSQPYKGPHRPWIHQSDILLLAPISRPAPCTYKAKSAVVHASSVEAAPPSHR